MIAWECVEQAESGGGAVLSLWRRKDEFAIRLDAQILMTSRVHASEQRLATLACEGLRKGRVLIGGLGMGFTLRAALDVLGAEVEVVVAEVSPQVVAWNRGVLSGLAGAPLDDGRVRVEVADVADQLVDGAAWDAVMLDTDNGPIAMAGSVNEGLYSLPSLMRMRLAMAVGGTLAFWSASPAPEFETRLQRAGFTCVAHRVPARDSGKGREHTVFIARAAGRRRA